MTARRKKGYLLLEMIMMIAMLSVVMLLSVRPMKLFFGTVLNTHQAFDQQDQVAILLSRLRMHTENAELAYVQSADERLGGDLLYLAGPDGLLCYQFADGAAVCVMADQTLQWDMPKVRFDWRLVTLPGDAQAVAITTYQHHRRRGDGVPAFVGSYLFVVNLNNAHRYVERQ